MSLNVGNNTSNFLSSTGVVASYPFAVAVRFRPNADSVDQCVWSSGADGTHYVALMLGSDNVVRFYIKDGASDSSADSGFFTYSAGQPYFYVMVALSATERRLYPLGFDLSFDPFFIGIDTASRDITAYTESLVGKGAGVSFDGTISELAIWKDFPGNPFDDATRGSMNTGVTPLLFASLLPYLVSYSRLVDDALPTVGEEYSVNGSVTWDAHPRVYWPSNVGFSGAPAPEGAHFTADVVEEDLISLTETISIVANVEDTISLEEVISNSKFQYVTDTISMSERVWSVPKFEDPDHVVLMEVITTTMSRERDADDDVVLYETILAIVNADCPTCCDNDEQYHPFIGTTDDPNAPTPPSATAPTLTPSHSVVLSWPVIAPSMTVTLRAPEFGNSDVLDMKKIKRESRGGTLQIYADPQWPKVSRLHMEFAVLTEAKAQEYLAFRKATLGKEIKLVDYESRIWTGVMTDTDSPITRAKRGCGLTASLAFEGELQ